MYPISNNQNQKSQNQQKQVPVAFLCLASRA